MPMMLDQTDFFMDQEDGMDDLFGEEQPQLRVHDEKPKDFPWHSRLDKSVTGACSQ
jgi:hypothetical protein